VSQPLEDLEEAYRQAEASFRDAYDLMTYWTAETNRRNQQAGAALRARNEARQKNAYFPPGIDPCRWGHNTFLTCPPETCRCLIENTLKKVRG
jgi:hypothetical protein